MSEIITKPLATTLEVVLSAIYSKISVAMGVFSKYINIFNHVIQGSKINNPRAWVSGG